MANIGSASKMISPADILALEIQCLEQIREDMLYALRNDAKLRAVLTSKSYEEFKNIVDSAHLMPLSASDKQNAKTKHRIWNSAVAAEQ